MTIHRKGHTRNGRNPTLVNGYDAYGIENISPFYQTEVLPRVEHGGVFVWSGVRGGGEYGRGLAARRPRAVRFASDRSCETRVS